MGLGAYLATSTERKHYQIELDRERRQVTMSADQEEEIMVKIFEGYGVGREELRPLARRLRSDADAWIQVLCPLPQDRHLIIKILTMPMHGASS